MLFSIGGGLFFVVVASALVLATNPPSNGKLVPNDSMLTWRSPVEKTFRQLSLDAAQATFRLENVGGEPVRILDSKTSCGCATPKIDPMIIAPGKTGIVEVNATPLQIGDKFVDITLTTDSPATPTIVLKLHIIGSRSAPFMFEARGDLNFPAGTPKDAVRFIQANQIEDAKSPPTPPIVKNDLKFIELSGPELEIERPSNVPGTVHRRYAFKAKNLLADGAPSQSGQIQVLDPWDHAHVEFIHAHCEESHPIKVSPSRAILAMKQGVARDKPVARFVVSTRETVSDLVVELENPDDSPLVLTRSSSDGEKLHLFSVSLKDEHSPDSLHQILVGRSTSPERIRIPVAIRNEVPR